MSHFTLSIVLYFLQLYNIEDGSTGYYKCLHPVKAALSYFDFDDVSDNFTLEGLSLRSMLNH